MCIALLATTSCTAVIAGKILPYVVSAVATMAEMGRAILDIAISVTALLMSIADGVQEAGMMVGFSIAVLVLSGDIMIALIKATVIRLGIVELEGTFDSCYYVLHESQEDGDTHAICMSDYSAL